MAKSLANTDDRQQTSASMESGGQSLFLSIPDTITPWYLLGLEYTSFFTHWYDGPQGKRTVVCAGGPEGGGFATDECAICNHVLELYQEGKRLREDGDDATGNKLKSKANDLRGKPQVILKAIRGQQVLIKGKDGIKRREPDFDMEDEDSNADIGLLCLSQAQWDGLIGLINGEHTPFIKSGEDLGNRVLYTKKEKRKGKSTKYTAVVWSADAEESELPEVELPPELAELDLDELGKIDEEEVEKVAAFLTGESEEDPDDDEEVALEDDSEEEPDNDYLDDIENDEDGYAEEGDDDSSSFEDDLPFDESELEESAEEEPEPPKKPVPKKTAPKKPVSKKATSKKTVVKKTTGTRKSGKARM